MFQQDVNHNCGQSTAVTAASTQKLLSSVERHVGDGITDVGRKPSRGRTLCALDWFGCLGEVKWEKSDQKCDHALRTASGAR